MPVNQQILADMIRRSNKELESAERALTSIDAQMQLVSNYDEVYRQILSEAQNRLETALNNKKTWFDNNYPDNAPHSIKYGNLYGTINLSDWEIVNKNDEVVYRYSKKIENLKSYSLTTDWSAIRTVRKLISGPAGNADIIRVGLQAASDVVTTLVNVSIGERIPNTRNIVDGTFKFFTFGGSNIVTINAGTIEYSDWLSYTIDSSKEYFITYFIDNGGMRRDTVGSGQNSFTAVGDQSLVQNWNTMGTAVSWNIGVSVVQGFELGYGQGWDQDVIIQQAVEDWAIIKQCADSILLGTGVLKSSLLRGKAVLQQKKAMLESRNLVLGHYVD